MNSPGVSVREVDSDFFARRHVWALHFAMMQHLHPTETLSIRDMVFFRKTFPEQVKYFVDHLAKSEWFLHEYDELITWRVIVLYRDCAGEHATEVVQHLCSDFWARNPDGVRDWYFRHAMFNPVIGPIDENDAQAYFLGTFIKRQVEISVLLRECCDAFA